MHFRRNFFQPYIKGRKAARRAKQIFKLFHYSILNNSGNKACICNPFSDEILKSVALLRRKGERGKGITNACIFVGIYFSLTLKAGKKLQQFSDEILKSVTFFRRKGERGKGITNACIFVRVYFSLK